MENASKALLMAAGVLIGILILALIAVLFLAGNEVFKGYEETKTSEMVQQFNSNFTKYMGQKLTAHQIITIMHFADTNNVHTVNYSGTAINIETIKSDLARINNGGTPNYSNIERYKIEIDNSSNDGYTSEGYINRIKISIW